MKITLIMPSVGKKPGKSSYVKTWCMEPLSIAVLASLTPKDVQLEFFDDRIEEINYETRTDLVAMPVETYTARRAYEIADKFRAKGIKVVMGGFHPTLIPDEPLEHCDSIVIGEAEDLWESLVRDVEKNQLKQRYICIKRPTPKGRFPDRSIFKGKMYLKIGLIETGRGCRFMCDFCSVTNFYNQSYVPRPIEDVIEEVKQLKYKFYFFVDDNMCADKARAEKLFNALIPLKIKWVGQASLNISQDEKFLKLMKNSGCVEILIGFESTDVQVLKAMKKNVNINLADYDKAVQKIQKNGIHIYATFVFGYSPDDEKNMEDAYNFALRNKLFLTAFNHLVPFPGTPLYKRFKEEKKLIIDKW